MRSSISSSPETCLRGPSIAQPDQASMPQSFKQIILVILFDYPVVPRLRSSTGQGIPFFGSKLATHNMGWLKCSTCDSAAAGRVRAADARPGALLAAGSSTGDVPQKAQRDQTTGETIGLWQLSEAGQEYHARESSDSGQ